MDSIDHHHQEVNKTIERNQETPQLCANGCGFYGTKANNNLCSSCFKKTLLKKEEKVETPNKNPFPCFKNNNINDEEGSFVAHEKVLCKCCNKKIRGLMIYKCRCGGKFCTKHRYPEEHSCNFDFKSLGSLELGKQNPVVMADKLDQRI